MASPTSSSGSRRRPHSPSAYDRSTSNSYPSSSSSRPHPQRSPSPTASNHSSSAYSRRNYDEPGPSGSSAGGGGGGGGALPLRPTFDPKGARRYDRRGGDRGDRDASGNTKSFYDRERDRDPGPSMGGRDTWVAPVGGGGKARGPPGGADDGWNSRRRGGDRGRDRDRETDSRDGRGGGGSGRAVYEREGSRAGDYNDITSRQPNRQPPPHLSESTSGNLHPPSFSNSNPGWQRRPNPPTHDSDRSSGYISHSTRPRNASGNTQPYSRAGAGPSNYSRPPPPSSMVDPSLWRTSYNPPPPSDQYPSLEYDPPARPGTDGSASEGGGAGGSELVRLGSGTGSGILPASIYDGQKRDDEQEEGEELEEGEVQSEDGEEKESKEDVSRTVKIEQIVQAALVASREEEAASHPSPPRSWTPPIPVETKEEPPPAATPSFTPPHPSPPPSARSPFPSTTAAVLLSITPPLSTVALPSPPILPQSAALPPPSLAKLESSTRPIREPSPRPSPPPPASESVLAPTTLATVVPVSSSTPPLIPKELSQLSLVAAVSEPLSRLPSSPPSSCGKPITHSSPSASTTSLPLPSIALPLSSPVVQLTLISASDATPAPVAETLEPDPKDHDAPRSSLVIHTASEQAAMEKQLEPDAMEVDEKKVEPVDPDATSTADVSMEIEPELKELEEEEDLEPAAPLTEEEIADVVVSQVQSRVALDPSTAVLEEETITSLIHFNTLLCDPPSSRLPLTPVSLANGSSPPLPLNLEPEPITSLSPLSSRSRQFIQVRIQVSVHEDSKKVERLRNEYRSINAEWQATCQRLDRLTEKRNAAKANANNFSQNVANGNLFTPSGAPNPGGGVFGYGGGANGGGGPTHNMPGGPPSLVSTFLEESSRSSRASRSRANNQDPNNLGYFADAARTEAEFQSILTALEDADSRDPNLRAARTTAVVPDMILRDMERVEDTFDDESGLVRDPEEFYREKEVEDGGWTQEEKEIFEKRFAGYPKQFGKIAEHLLHKTAPQCVLYYYRTKKSTDYRTIVAQRGGAGRRKGGRRAANKGSRLLSNLNQGKRPKPPIDEPVPNRSGTATPRFEDDDSNPATPAPGGDAGPSTTKKKRSRVAGGDSTTMDESGSSSAFGAQAKKARLFDLSADGAVQGRTSTGRGDDLLSGRNLAAPDPSAARLAAIEAGEMTPAPKKPSNAKPRRKKPSSVVPPQSALVDPSAPSPDSLDPSRPFEEQLVNGAPKESSNKRKKSLVNSYWSAAEKAGFLQGLMSYGKEWALISQSMGGVKTAIQAKNYFSANAEALGLEEIAEAAMGDLVALLNGADEGDLSTDPASHFDQSQPGLFESLGGYPAQPPPPSGLVLPPMDLGRPRSAMNIHDLLNSPDKPLPATTLSASRPPPPMWQQSSNDYDRERGLEPGRRPPPEESYQRGEGAPNDAGDGRIPAPHPSHGDPYRGGPPPPSSQRWAGPSPLGYPSDDRRPPASYEQDSRSNYPPPPPPHHYPPSPSDRPAYPPYSLPASHPPPPALRHPYGDYPPSSNVNNTNLPLPSRPYSAGPPPQDSSSTSPSWPPPPPGHYHRLTSDYGPPLPQHQQPPSYHSFSRYPEDRSGPEGPYGAATPPLPSPQEYQRGGPYPEGAYGGERERLAPLPPGGSWGPGAPPGWQPGVRRLS